MYMQKHCHVLYVVVYQLNKSIFKNDRIGSYFQIETNMSIYGGVRDGARERVRDREMEKLREERQGERRMGEERLGEDTSQVLW